MRARIWCLVAILVAGFQASAVAQPATPDPDDIAAALSLQIPAYWQVGNVEIQASVNDGDDVSPRFRQRFTADLTPREDLFRIAQEVGPFKVVVAVAHVGERYKLYGIGVSILRTGQWTTELALENSLQGMGAPRSMFDGPVVVAGAETSQQAIETYLLGLETAKAFAERAARTSANADLLRKLAVEADAQERALLKDAHSRRIAALTARLDSDLAKLNSAIDAMIAENQNALMEIVALHERKVAAATVDAEIRLAITETRKEIAAQDELAAVLEALAAKRKHTADLAAQAFEGEVAERKKRHKMLRDKLASDDVSEQMAAFDAAIGSQDDGLRRVALTSALRSGNDDLQGAALAAFISEMPQMTISVGSTDDDRKPPAYVQTFRITAADGAAFTGEFSTPGFEGIAQGSGMIHGDNLSLFAQWKNRAQCSWNAQINVEGVLRGLMQCADRLGRVKKTISGIGSVSF